MRLSRLVSGLPIKSILGDEAVEIRGIACHSGQAAEGFLFAALPGFRQEGRRFIPEALARGARAILVDRPAEAPGAVQVIVPEVRSALALLSAAFYREPSAQLTLVGLTGTNGKTTTAYLIESILQEGGRKVGVLGTVNYRFNGRTQPAPTTTPESLDLQRHLRSMVEAGVTHAVMEVSSHALALQRVRGCHLDLALFTNFTRDHLDFHGSLEAYFEAKELLFTQILGESRKGRRFAVINGDDPWGERMGRRACAPVVRYGLKSPAEVRPEEVGAGPEGLRARLVTPRGGLTVTSPLIGRHNLYNILAAVTVGCLLEVPLPAIAAGVERLGRVPGRLERVPGGAGLRVYVDYAHTPDALERVLETLRETCPGRLIVVFGCGGDRDRGKRPPMGRAAAERCELAVVTSDNPRSEDPLAIIAEVEKGVVAAGRKKLSPQELREKGAGEGYAVVPDRREAIGLAVTCARPGDVVLIAGKGHEDYQILGEKRIPFDDCREAAEALAWKRGKEDH
ncbi:MAG: UDP-N-acetylmuramoyl-L-alanyl-D-glutamate--2,6-diaminopimelate ligase [Deltaproteobacteria bacterium]|nr:UDP-N-acetylmuramoyl-L-alanyl-D-glutamate--2,6-diaminopimelate ligase [Deltaproteobacteria bacterium]